MASRCAIIVCDHGLGHVRRCALMAKEREKTGEHVTLFAPRASVECLQRAVPSTNGLTVHDFATETTPGGIRQGLPDTVNWLGRLPDLDAYDTVICDNLPEILSRRSDAMISAQFFWHDVIEGAASDYAGYCEELLVRHSPAVIGCEMFATDAVRRQSGFKPVGLYKIPELVVASAVTPIEHRTDLLVTGGSTLVMRRQFQDLISDVLQNGPGEYQRVYVDPELMPQNAPTWMLRADFSIAMYCKLKAAVCRPGLGVVTDLITVGAYIFPVFEPHNLEMKHNSIVVNSFNEKINHSKGLR